MFGVSCTVVTAHDGSLAVTEIRAVHRRRTIHDKLMAAVIDARQQRGLTNMNP
jgi:hypothetical protein